MPADGWRILATVDNEVMSLGFAADRFMDRVDQQSVILAGTQRRPQISCIFLSQAHIKRAGAGQTDAIARLTEIMCQRGDEADSLARFRDIEIARRAAGGMVGFRKCPAFCQIPANHRKRQILVEALFADFTKRHDFDKGQIKSTFTAPVQHAVEFIIVHTAKCDGIDLDCQSCSLCGGDTIKDAIQISPARDCLELVGVACVERDIDPFDPRIGEFLSIPRKLCAVGGQGQFIQRP